MHRPPRAIRLVVLLVVLTAVVVGAWYYFDQQTKDSGLLTASGTIEADAVTIGPQAPGRVVEVNADEGQAVVAGSPLVVLDGEILNAQRDQAEAAIASADANAAAVSQNAVLTEPNVASAEAAVNAAEANLALLEAGPTDEQLAVAQANVDAAQVAVDNLDDAYDELSSAAEDTPAGRALKLQRDVARANLDTALAQQQMTEAGARPEQIGAAQAQVDAARAQADGARAQASVIDSQVAAAEAQAAAARSSLAVIDAQIAQLTLTAPIDGMVLTRSIEPGEYAGPGAALLVIGRLDELTITVYVPEDRYGELRLGQAAQVTVDSFPGVTFSGQVVHIADQAEFTPRNVQTPEGRKSTVFAIKLGVDDPDGRLKPGMPADVTF